MFFSTVLLVAFIITDYSSTWIVYLFMRMAVDVIGYYLLE